jgi:hypothetical protein
MSAGITCLYPARPSVFAVVRVLLIPCSFATFAAAVDSKFLHFRFELLTIFARQPFHCRAYANFASFAQSSDPADMERPLFVRHRGKTEDNRLNHDRRERAFA